MVFLVSIALLVLLLYSFTVFMLWRGLGRLEKKAVSIPDIPLPVSVLIPFRNEEEHILALLDDLEAQTYPMELVEIIFVNDHSTDDSPGLLRTKLRTKLRTNTRFTCLDLPANKAGKKEALSFAVEHATYDWFIQTDADCRVRPNFIALHMAFREEQKSDLVAGLVTTHNGNTGFLQLFERLDLLGLVGAGAGSFHYKRPLMCNGANLAYSRALYMETRRFEPVRGVASGDDMFLLIGARKLGKTLSYLADQEAMVQTSPATSAGSIISQRMRWGSKTVYYHMIDIQLMALLVVLANMIVLFIPLFLILIPGAWTWLLSTFLGKTLVDFTLLYRITSYTGQKKSLWLFLPVSLLYYLMQLVIITGSLVKRKNWKGRKL